MASRFENFGLSGLVERGEDAFRLCSLAMAEGQRVRGYRGDYYRLYLGDAIVSLRTMRDAETGEELLLGLDTHAVSDCVWDLPGPELWLQRIEGERLHPAWEADPALLSGDPMQRWAVRSDFRQPGAHGVQASMVPISVVNADVLTWMEPGPVRLNMAAFPRWVEYFTGEEDYAAAQRQKPPFEDRILDDGDFYEAGLWADQRRGPEYPPLEKDQVLLRGLVKDARVGETYLGMEPLTKFLSVTVSTRFGDVELCHPFDMVAEEQKDSVRPGAIVSALCTLSGDAAIGGYAGGVVFSEEKGLELLQYFFLRGGARRLQGAVRSDCAVTFLENRQEGVDSALALLETVGERLQEAGLCQCVPGRVTGVDQTGETPPPCRPGRRCLLLGDGERGGRYAFLCLVDTDSLGRIREITITNDSRLDCEPDTPHTGAAGEQAREKIEDFFEKPLSKDKKL